MVADESYRSHLDIAWDAPGIVASGASTTAADEATDEALRDEWVVAAWRDLTTDAERESLAVRGRVDAGVLDLRLYRQGQLVTQETNDIASCGSDLAVTSVAFVQDLVVEEVAEPRPPCSLHGLIARPTRDQTDRVVWRCAEGHDLGLVGDLK